jgi:hypothetical protein
MLKRCFKKRVKQKSPLKNLYTYWETFLLSFYSQEVYVDAAKRWRGFGALYLFFVCFILTFPLYFKFVGTVNSYFKEYIMPSVSVAPDLLIHNGTVTIMEKGTGKPMKKQVWIWPATPSAKYTSPFILISPTRTSDSFSTVSIPILVTHNAVRLNFEHPFMKKAFLEKMLIPISTKDDHLLSADLLTRMAENTRSDFIALGYCLMAYLLWGAGLIFLYVFSILGRMVASMFLYYPLRWKESIRLLVVASTPSLVYIDVVYSFTSLNTYWLITFCLMTFMYFCFGVKGCRIHREPIWNPSFGSMGYE